MSSVEVVVVVVVVIVAVVVDDDDDGEIVVVLFMIIIVIVVPSLSLLLRYPHSTEPYEASSKPPKLRHSPILAATRTYVIRDNLTLARFVMKHNHMHTHTHSLTRYKLSKELSWRKMRLILYIFHLHTQNAYPKAKSESIA